MALYCELCGTRTDGVERLGVYCPGEYCGTDLRAGADAGVRAWCEPERRFGVAGGTVLVDLLVCNSGPRATGFHLEPVEPVRGRLDFDRRAAGAPLASGATRRIELRYTVPLDLVGPALDIASRFGVPAADVVGRAQGALPSRFGVALRVAATSAHQGAACAAFAVDVPGQLDVDLDHDGVRGRDDGNRSGGSSGGRPATPGRPQRPGQPDGGTGSRTGGGCGPLVIAVLVAVVAVLVAVVVVLGLGRGRGTSTAGPVEGTEVPAGATVVLRVSDGRAPVPAVAGLTRADAEQLLRDLHFTKVTVFSEQDGTKPLNQALRTDPAAGTVVALDAPVTLWFATRPVLR
ncbi:PASTA domain-containing protein [Kitasatospora purpeofusca]|uniref:PASTA domain-containing protein n=1 Tax=Kitasatospora purpeofusca TaxID=67352 RepID=UPI002E129F77|nr:PASTA domain-containing protein [Kitasatospora purpeofusca]